MVQFKYKLGGASVALLAIYMYAGIIAVAVAAGTLAYLKLTSASTTEPAAKTPVRRPNPYDRGSGGIGATPLDDRERPMAVSLYLFDGRKWVLDAKGNTLSEMDIAWTNSGSGACGCAFPVLLFAGFYYGARSRSLFLQLAAQCSPPSPPSR